MSNLVHLDPRSWDLTLPDYVPGEFRLQFELKLVEGLKVEKIHLGSSYYKQLLGHFKQLRGLI